MGHAPVMQHRPLQRQRLPRRQTPLRLRLLLQLPPPAIPKQCHLDPPRGITADTALRFARYFKNSPAFWMNLQTCYDLEVARNEIAAKVARDVQPLESVGAREG